MHQLLLPPGFPLPLMNRAIAERETMHLNDDAHYVSVGLSALRIFETALGGAEPLNFVPPSLTFAQRRRCGIPTSCSSAKNMT
jgi:hypothetical protein